MAREREEGDRGESVSCQPVTPSWHQVLVMLLVAKGADIDAVGNRIGKGDMAL
jgi:hypothetical protein